MPRSEKLLDEALTDRERRVVEIVSWRGTVAGRETWHARAWCVRSCVDISHQQAASCRIIVAPLLLLLLLLLSLLHGARGPPTRRALSTASCSRLNAAAAARVLCLYSTSSRPARRPRTVFLLPACQSAHSVISQAVICADRSQESV